MEERTEEASPRKLRKARERGEVAKSPLATTALVVAGTFFAVAWEAKAILASWQALFTSLWTSSPPVAEALSLAGATAARSLFWPLAVAVVCGALGNVLQVGPLFAPKALAPDWGRLHLGRGLARIFSKDELVARLGAGSVALVVFALAAELLLAALFGLAGGIERAPFLLGTGARVLEAFFVRAGVVLAVAGVVAWIYRRTRHRIAQRMSRRELLREAREQEGDPAMRRRHAQRRRELATAAERSLVGVAIVIAGVQRAVALRWNAASDEPPEIGEVAHGAAAPRLVSRARAHGVPIAHDEVLAFELDRLTAGATLRRAALRRLARHLAAHRADRR